jgi:peptidyl-prolyl isomerase D
VGNKLWKEGKASEALEKWQSTIFFPSMLVRKPLTRINIESLRYLDWHPEFTISKSSEDGKPFSEEPASEPNADANLKKSFQELVTPLLLNSALAVLKLGGSTNARTAKGITDRALNEPTLSDADRGAPS